MRCPKCGYITFDSAERCGRCTHDLLAVAAQLRGAMAKVTPPLFLGRLARAATAETAAAESVGLDLGEEALDLGAIEEEAEAITLVAEAPAFAEAAEAEEALEMPSLSGIDVSDLLPSQAEAEEEEAGGIAMPEMSMAQDAEPEVEPAPPSMAEGDDLALDFDLAGGEGRGEPELAEAAGGVLDLADLLGGGPEESAPPATALPEQLSLSLESSEPAAGGEEGLDLTLEGEAAPPAVAEASASPVPDIPDLGLTLESDGEEEPAA